MVTLCYYFGIIFICYCRFLEFLEERLHLVAFFYFVLIFGFGCGLSFGYAQDDIVVLERIKSEILGF